MMPATVYTNVMSDTPDTGGASRRDVEEKVDDLEKRLDEVERTLAERARRDREHAALPDRLKPPALIPPGSDPPAD